MRLLALSALLTALCAQSECQGFFGTIGKGIDNIFGITQVAKNPCEQDPFPIFRDAVSDFSTRLMKRAAFYSKGTFIISPYTIWLSLTAISEFADQADQKELFTALNLPAEKCIRQSLYHIALGIEKQANDLRFDRNRVLAIDEKVEVNKAWKDYADSTNILKYLSVAFDEASFQNVPATMGISSKIALDGHSIILDRLDFGGLWQTAFSDGTVERAPFFNDLGQEVATVEYMRMTSKVRLAHIPIINAKVLQLPLGMDGRYSMLLTMGVNNNTVKNILDLLMNSVIIDIMKALTLSQIPINVAVPKFSFSAGYDARRILEDLGLGRVFSDPDITRHISYPPAWPSAYLQKISVNITCGNFGLRQPTQPQPNSLSGVLDLASNTATGIASAIGRDFIANKPFIFTLIEEKSLVSVFTGVYSYDEARRTAGFPLNVGL